MPGKWSAFETRHAPWAFVGGFTFLRRLVVLAGIVIGISAILWYGTMVDEQPPQVTLSISGLPPFYSEKQWLIDITPEQREVFESLIDRAHFFELPAQLGGNVNEGRDMGTYKIAVSLGSRSHAVEFSDSSINQELADLMNWLKMVTAKPTKK
jgi:hypothetical protein